MGPPGRPVLLGAATSAALALNANRIHHLYQLGPGSGQSSGIAKADGSAREETSVRHFTMLVTPNGQWVLPDSAEFYTALGDLDPDYDAVMFAVKNLGFIKFQVIQHSIVEIELHPRNVELRSLRAVQDQLRSSKVNLFRIKY